jgi:hypothetical protein
VIALFAPPSGEELRGAKFACFSPGLQAQDHFASGGSLGVVELTGAQNSLIKAGSINVLGEET